MPKIAVFFFAGMLLVTGCGATSTNAGVNAAPRATATPVVAPGTLVMGLGDFVGNTHITITAGQAVTFQFSSPTADLSYRANQPEQPAGGGFHQLITGRDGAFVATPNVPTEFATANGMFIHIGGSHTVTFPKAGTFPITCIIHPAMQATITVTP